MKSRISQLISSPLLKVFVGQKETASPTPSFYLSAGRSGITFIIAFSFALTAWLSQLIPAEADDRRFLTNNDPGCFNCLGWFSPFEVQRLTQTGEWQWDYRVEAGVNILPAVLTGLDEY
ncbi:MAG: hypothetical protein AAB538_04660, partial [Patescibacteria group bacterium]